MDLVAPVIIFLGLGYLFAKFAQNPLRLTMILIVFQKIIDMTWFFGITIGVKISLQRVAYVLIPLALLLVLPSKMKKYKKLYQQNIPMIGFMMAFVGWMLFNLIRIKSVNSSIEQVTDLFRIIGPYVVFLAGWQYFDNEEKFDEFARLFVLTYIISFISLMLQYTGIFDLSNIGIAQQRESGYGLEDKSRFTGLYYDAGSLTVYLITLVPLALYLLSKPNEPKKYQYAAMIGVAVVSLLLARVRTTSLAIIAGIFAWYFFNRNYAIFGFAIFGGFYALFNSEIINKFFGDVAVIVETGSIGSAHLTGRTALWNMIMDDFNRNDLITQLLGLGIGADEVLVGHAGAAHSDYYTYLYNTGYIGVALYFSVIYVAAFKGFQNILTVYSDRFPDQLKKKYFVWLSIHIFYMIGFYAHPTRWVAYTFPLWFLAGFALKNPEFFLAQYYEPEEEGNELLEVNEKLAHST